MGPPSHIRKGDFMKYVLGAKCVKCGREYPAAPGLTTCACGGILDIVYDYAAIRRDFSPKSLADCRDYSMWRYRPLLPVEEESVPPPLRVGWSPLYKADRLARALGLEAWGVAADGQNYRGQTMRDLREILARDKDVLWAIFQPEPTYLGDPEPLTGTP